jgi:hypothetical protein
MKPKNYRTLPNVNNKLEIAKQGLSTTSLRVHQPKWLVAKVKQYPLTCY